VTDDTTIEQIAAVELARLRRVEDAARDCWISCRADARRRRC